MPMYSESPWTWGQEGAAQSDHNNQDNRRDETQGGLRLRMHLVCLLTAGAMAVCGLQREAFSYTMRLALYHDPHCLVATELGYINGSCGCILSGVEDQENRSEAEFYWSSAAVRLVTQTFLFSLLMFAVPAGILADLYGGKWVLVLGLVVSALVAGAFPSLSTTGPGGLMVARLFTGLAQALVIPSSVVIIVQWSINEHVTLVSIVTAGEFVGYGLAYGYQPYNWEEHYYITAGIAALWALLWLIIVPDKVVTPLASSTSFRRSSTSFRRSSTSLRRSSSQVGLLPRIPWKPILTSPPVLSLLLLHWASCWFHKFLMSTQIYFMRVMGLSESQSVNVTTFAEFSIGPSTILWGVVSDYLVKRDYISHTTNRKSFIFSSNLITAAFLVLLPVAGCFKLFEVVIILCLSYFRGLYYCMYCALPIDLSPQHCGFLMGLIVSTSATATNFSWDIFKKTEDSFEPVKDWRNITLVTAVLLVVLSLPFLKYGSAALQPWNTQYILSRPTSNLNQQNNPIRS